MAKTNKPSLFRKLVCFMYSYKYFCEFGRSSAIDKISITFFRMRIRQTPLIDPPLFFVGSRAGFGIQ